VIGAALRSVGARDSPVVSAIEGEHSDSSGSQVSGGRAIQRVCPDIDKHQRAQLRSGIQSGRLLAPTSHASRPTHDLSADPNLLRSGQSTRVAAARRGAPVSEPAALAPPLLAWHARSGRHDLPWQQHISAYRVWISEVMLQQTQVATVIPYFERFMAQFPDVASLAGAPLDVILHHWSGLGYYSRARNLHRAAQRVVAEFAGELPTELAALQSLPGIGRSTAGAILALTLGQRVPILDGNVRRVLARYFAVPCAPGVAAVDRQFWALAEACMPQGEVATYTQAVMDLGATVCLRRRPLCTACPLQNECAAHLSGQQLSLPTPRVRTARPVRRVVMLLARRTDGAVLLERRSEQGIWGGLWSLPEFHSDEDARAFGADRLLRSAFEPEFRATLRHAFTHFELEISPLVARCEGFAGVRDSPPSLWFNTADPPDIGLPAPVTALLAAL
jgi:A/G-specific adenine glycosylase